MKYLLLYPGPEHFSQVVDLDHAITIDDLYFLLDCKSLDFFSHDRYYVACDDTAAFYRPINLLASLYFGRELHGSVLVGLLHDPDLPFSDPDLYPLSRLDIADILGICIGRIIASRISRSPEL